MALTLTTDERTELERCVGSPQIRAEDVRRARVILMLAIGDSYSTIEADRAVLPELHQTVAAPLSGGWVGRVVARYRGQPPTVVTPAAGTVEPAGRGSRTRSG